MLTGYKYKCLHSNIVATNPFGIATMVYFQNCLVMSIFQEWSISIFCLSYAEKSLVMVISSTVKLKFRQQNVYKTSEDMT